MNKTLRAMAVAGLTSIGIVQTWADPAIKDPPGVTRMNNYEPGDQDDRAFDERTVCLAKGFRKLEGKIYRRNYTVREGATVASPLQITRNYANAVRGAGGQVILDGEPSGDCDVPNSGRMFTGVIKRGNAESWIVATPRDEGQGYELIVVEVQAMAQEVTANAMREALNRDGRIALYINFDTGKSTIRADSQGVINQIVELMKSDPALKIAVEGHTDNVGQAAANKALSDARAKSVVAAVSAAGIAVARMTPAGFGAERPVADNKDEAGRAKNRRVELVKR